MPSKAVIVTVPDRERPDRPDRPDRPPPSGGASTILAPTDLTFLGYYRWAYYWDLWFSYGQLAIRRVNGELRLFTNGNTNDNYPLTEYVLPAGAEPHLDITQAPLLTAGQGLGQVHGRQHVRSRRRSCPTAAARTRCSPGRGGTRSATASGTPTATATRRSSTTRRCFSITCDDATGVGTYYGPWRIEGPVNHVRGGLIPIPVSVRPAAGGNELAVLASQASGNASCPFGCNLHTFKLPDPFTHPPDSNQNEIPSIVKRTVLMHDVDHRQARSDNYKNCYWTGGQYNCLTHGSGMTPGVPLWGGPDPESSGDDTVATAVCIDTPTKQGVLFIGTLAETPPGYVRAGSATPMDRHTSGTGRPSTTRHRTGR